MPPLTARLIQIRQRLEDIQSDFHSVQEIKNDPITMVLDYHSPADREVAGFIAAVFSYGNVKHIQQTLKTVFEVIGPTPALTLKKNDGLYWKKNIPKNFKHRFNTADDLGCLLTWLGEALKSNDTLEDFFLAQNSKGPITDIGLALENFIDGLTKLNSTPYKPKKTKGVHFFLTRPSNKSACKRLMLFLRWVTGAGPMDLGLWKRVSPSLLLIPVDTHVLRVSRHLGFTKRKDNSWRTAQEITEVLKILDPKDPTRFDFAICHLGISKECPSRFNLKICSKCRMNDVCVTYAKRR
jgi:uncharacterized protein (TIGR02757 family)